MKPFRFGVSAATAYSFSEWADLAKKAETLGYSTFHISDHISGTLALVPALMSAADATEKIRVGPFVADNDFRHPVMFAKEAATIDLLSEGRLELGLGAGWLREDYAATGIPFDPPGVRVDRFAEGLEIIKRYLTGEPFSFAGAHYKIEHIEPFPVGVQEPYPPLLVGGGGRRMLALAAHEADIVSLMPKALAGGGLDPAGALLSTFLEQLLWIKQEAGPRFEEIELNVLNQRVVVTNDRQEAAERVAAEWAEEGLEVTPEDVFRMPLELIGTVDEIVTTLEYRREVHGISYITVFDRYIDVFAPVVDRLAGT